MVKDKIFTELTTRELRKASDYAKKHYLIGSFFRVGINTRGDHFGRVEHIDNNAVVSMGLGSLERISDFTYEGLTFESANRDDCGYDTKTFKLLDKADFKGFQDNENFMIEEWYGLNKDEDAIAWGNFIFELKHRKPIKFYPHKNSRDYQWSAFKDHYNTLSQLPHNR